VSSGSTSEFFDALAERGYEPMLEKVDGAARFDVVDNGRTERWLVTIEKGQIRVSRTNARAATVVRSDRRTFDQAAAGKLNVMAAVLRGEIGIEGDLRFLVRLQRLFPRPGKRR
jgi:putative sterol carrier protein